MILPLFTTSTLLLLLSGLTTPAVAHQNDGWHFDEVATLVTEQLDPIINPNAQGTHMHRVVGGSNFRAAYSYDGARSGKCSSVAVQGDKSNYWMPQLYWINDDKTFTPLPADIRFYYFLAPNNEKDPVVQFPDGLRILSGNPNAKSKGPVEYAFNCQVDANRAGDVYRTDFNFERDCPRGMKTNLYMPNCWNGKDLWLPGGTHMSWTANGGTRGGACPWSHPIKIPSVMLEYTWRTDQWKAGVPLKGRLAWANGDTTGYGIHGDFTNGWDRNLLAKAMSDPGCVNSGGAVPANSCPVFKSNMDLANFKQCRPDAGILTERAGNGDLMTIASLPGCNPLWGNTPTKPGCSSYPQYDISPFKANDGGYTAVASQRRDRPVPSSAGWIPLGCVKESSSFVEPTAYLWPKTLTQDLCMKQCASTGKKFAAVGGHADNCICSNGIKDNAPVMTGLCNAPCPGNPSQTCGTAYAYNVYGAGPGTTASSPANPANVVRSLDERTEVEEKRSGWKAMLGSGQGRMIKRSD